jgi:large subunit ribosomal protein L2
MGKNLIQQARGKGGPTYRAPSFRYLAKVSYPQQSTTSGTITDIVKSRGHSGPLAQMKYDNGEESYVVAAEGIRVGDNVLLGNNAPAEKGNTLCLKDIPVGANIFNIELQPGDGGKIVRSGGCTAKVIAKRDNDVIVMLPSKK